MIIDFHTHIFPDGIVEKTIPFLEQRSGVKANTDGTMNGLLQAMEEGSVNLSVVHPVVTKPSQFESVNAFAKYVNDTGKGRLISFGGIHPDCDNYKEKLDHIKELGLMILTHAGVDIGLPEPVHCPPDRMRKVIDTIHPKKLIVAHLGGWNQWDMVYEYLAGENIYLDTAFSLNYIDETKFLKIWEKHDHSKLLFATDSPWAAAEQMIELVKQLPISEKDKMNILGYNAKKLLELT